MVLILRRQLWALVLERGRPNGLGNIRLVVMVLLWILFVLSAQLSGYLCARMVRPHGELARRHCSVLLTDAVSVGSDLF